MRWSTPVSLQNSVSNAFTNSRPWSEMRMVGQPCRHINLKTNPATEAADLSLRASASGRFAKEACTSGYVFIPSFCFWKGTNQINPYGMPNLVSHWDWMDASWGLTEFGVGTLAFVTGLGHLQYISDDTHPVVSFLNLLHHFVPSKVCSTDWVIVASLEDLYLHWVQFVGSLKSLGSG